MSAIEVVGKSENLKDLLMEQGICKVYINLEQILYFLCKPSVFNFLSIAFVPEISERMISIKIAELLAAIP